MESSDSSLSGDWDVINQKEIPEELPLEMNLNNGPEEVKVCPPVGSGVHVLTEEDINHHNDILSETNIYPHNEILNETDLKHHNDSNSSSDIDIIEEGDEDMHHSGMLSSPREFLDTNLAESGPLVPANAPTPARVPSRARLPIYRLIEPGVFPLLRDYLITDFFYFALVVIVSVGVFLLVSFPEYQIMKRMKEQVDELKRENSDLKNRVISKIEDDKLFQSLEEQINTLKIENHRLSSSLESLILYLEEQTESFKKDNKIKEKDPYKIEIDKLKEQVNILKIDNDGLQQQLVLMRYGAFLPYSDDAKDDSRKKREVKLDQEKDAHENSSDVLVKEIEKLKKKLYSEVNDLKDWKNSIDNIIKHLNEKEKKGHENRGDFNSRKGTDDAKSKKYTKEENQEKKKQGKGKFYNWSWKDFKKNFGGTFDNINVSDMFSKYVNVNEKKVKEAFETVGSYFKKAQEQTRNMFKHYKEKGKNEVWDFLGALRKTWATMKHEFDENHPKKGPMPPEHDNRNFASDFSENQAKFENEKKKSTEWKNILDQHSNQNGDNIVYKELADDIMKHASLKHITGNDPIWKESFKKFLEEDLKKFYEENTKEFNEDAKKPEISWLFKRAVIRSMLREEENEGEFGNKMNWFLRRNKLTKEEDNEFKTEEDDLIN